MNRELLELAKILKLELTPGMSAQLDRLHRWLGSEGVTSGGLGPREYQRLEGRHLADSLAYAAGWSNPPDQCLDLGTGVGLPGLVLGAVWPETAMTLVDRSAKRCDLARRASRVAEIEVQVLQADIFSVSSIYSGDRTVDAVVSRAAIPATRLRPVLERLLISGGRAVVSGSGEPVEGFTNLKILDRPTRLLMMQM